jgi:hypothetical protein
MTVALCRALCSGLCGPKRAAVVLALCGLGAFVSARWVAGRGFEDVHPDFREAYYPGAVGIRRTGAYIDGAGRLITHWPPGYSLLIAPFVTDAMETTLARLRWVHAALAVLWVLALSGLIRKAVPAARVGVLLSLAVFWPPMLGIGQPGYSELPLAVSLAGAAWLFAELLAQVRLTGRGVALACLTGGLFGLAALIKTLALPAAGVALVVLLAGARRHPARALYGALVALGFAAVLLPWVLTYAGHTGHIGFTSAGLSSTRDGLVRFSHLAVARDLADGLSTATGPADAVWRCWSVVRQDPPGTVFLLAAKFARVWFGTYSGRYDALLAVCNVPWMLLFLGATCAACRRPAWASPVHGFLIGSVWAVWLAAFSVLPLFRYLSGVFPFAVIPVCAWLGHSRGTGMPGLAPTRSGRRRWCPFGVERSTTMARATLWSRLSRSRSLIPRRPVARTAS